MKEEASKISWPGWLAVAAAFALMAWLAWHTDRAMAAFDARAVPADTLQGLPEPRFFLETDSYVWLSLTRDMLMAGDWRVRWTAMDNAPAGRPVHWSQLLIWELAGLAKGLLAVQGGAPTEALALAGRVAPLVQLALTMALLYGLSARRLGWKAAAALAVALAVCGASGGGFDPTRPDHHGMQMVFLFGAFWCLCLGGFGWVSEAGVGGFLPRRAAGRYFAWSGVLAGFSLWTGAAVWQVGLAGIGLCGVWRSPAFRRSASGEEYARGLWLRWLACGGGTAVAGYLLEYAPGWFSMRLEVNHPLYWASWAGVALGLWTLGGLRRETGDGAPGAWRRLTARQGALLAAAAALAVSLPVVVLWGPAEWYWLRDPALARLHEAFIREFTHAPWLKDGAWTLATAFPACGLGLVALAWALVSRRAALRGWPRMAAGLLLAWVALFFAAYTWQRRWGFHLAIGMEGALSLAVAWADGGRGKWTKWVLAVLLAALACEGGVGMGQRVWVENQAAAGAAAPEEWIHNSLCKRNALRCLAVPGVAQWRLAGDAAGMPEYYYFAGIPSLASFYWENRDGWRAEVAMMADESADGEVALAVARERGITHLLAKDDMSFAAMYRYLATGVPATTDAIGRTFCGRLSAPPYAGRPGWVGGRDEELSEYATLWRLDNGTYAREKHFTHVFPVTAGSEAAR